MKMYPDGRRWETYYVIAEVEERDSQETTCCGGTVPAGTDACCVKDAEAKASGEAGCGCGSARANPTPLPDWNVTSG
jgi:hypothetical protein